jgi:hypothetical protein
MNKQFKDYASSTAARFAEKSKPVFKSMMKRFSEGTESSFYNAKSQYSGSWKAASKFVGGVGKGVGFAYGRTVGNIGRATSWMGKKIQGRGTSKVRSTVGQFTSRTGSILQKPMKIVKGMAKGPGAALRAAKAGRRAIKSIPKPIRKFGKLGGLALGATAMLGLSVLKGAMNQGKQIAYDRYMQDQSQSRQVLGSTRIGNASGTNRMIGYGGTTGLSNALSGTRHGR